MKRLLQLFRRAEDFDTPAVQAERRESGGRTERFGRWTESIARGMGTPWFLLLLTIVCAAWMAWNTVAPEEWRFDSAALGFTALTLLLSLQASYAAPLLLLAQNRQDDRDRVQIEQDRQRAERNLADTEFLAREVVALRLAIKELPDKDYLRQELRAMFAELAEELREENMAARGETASAAGAATAPDAAGSGAAGSDAARGAEGVNCADSPASPTESAQSSAAGQ